MIRYSLSVKFIAVLLCAVALVACLGSAVGIAQLVKSNLYTDTINDFLYKRLEFQAYELADSLTERYAITQLSNCSAQDLKELGYRHYFEDVLNWSGFNEESFSYTVSTPDQRIVDASVQGLEEGLFFEMVCSSQYPVLVRTEEDAAVLDQVYGKGYVRQETVSLSDYEDPVTIRYYPTPKCSVNITLMQDASLNRFSTAVSLVKQLYDLRYLLIVSLALSLLLITLCVFYICVAAGRDNRSGQIRVRGLNLLPLDLYAIIVVVAGILMLPYGIQLIYNWTQTNRDFNPGTVTLAGLTFCTLFLLVVGLFYAAVSQIKMGLQYWTKRLIFYHFGRWLSKTMRRLLTVLPMTWKYLLTGLIFLAGVLTALPFALKGIWLPLGLLALAGLLLLIYNAYAYGVLIRGAERMAKGNLNSKIDTRFLVGSYALCARDLNILADVAVEAARKQMKADRMRTELITNISHDIKTPLTSIVSYVDLLSSAKNAQQRTQYLEVLGRQSLRLKKLIEDLVELSKASTGNISVNLLPMDAEETMNQVLGEFSDKLENAGLTVVFQPSGESLPILADGRLTWRVMSNLLSNIVKYAMPGTRVYAQAYMCDGEVCLSLKNVSREPLTASPEELMERFVRGDASRHTEGSGLGLNIAKSLMELQKGQLRLQVDADLFHATAVFPAVHQE